jgi:hypothetical protein
VSLIRILTLKHMQNLFFSNPQRKLKEMQSQGSTKLSFES